MLCEALATASSGTGTIIEERVVTQSHRMTPQTCCCVIRAENDMRGGQCAPPVPVAACERASCVLRLCRSSHECSARNLDPERKRSLNGTMPQGAACGTAAAAQPHGRCERPQRSTVSISQRSLWHGGGTSLRVDAVATPERAW